MENAEQTRLTASVIRHEIEAVMGRSLDSFRYVRQYDLETDQWTTYVRMSANEHHVGVWLSDEGLRMALDAFKSRIVVPMVECWRALDKGN